MTAPTALQSVLASARAQGMRVRTLAAAPVAEVALPDFAQLLRVMSVTVVVAVATAIMVWTRVEVRTSAAALSTLRSQLAAAQVEHDRLALERALLRQPGRLQADADRLGLVAPVAVMAVEGAR